MESRNHNSGFLFGLIIGAIIGAVMMTIFGTNEGKKFIKKLRRKIDELINEVEDEADDTRKQLFKKAKNFEKGIADKIGKIKIKAVKIKEETQEKILDKKAAMEIGDKLFSKQGKRN